MIDSDLTRWRILQYDDKNSSGQEHIWTEICFRKIFLLFSCGFTPTNFLNACGHSLMVCFNHKVVLMGLMCKQDQSRVGIKNKSEVEMKSYISTLETNEVVTEKTEKVENKRNKFHYKQPSVL